MKRLIVSLLVVWILVSDGSYRDPFGSVVPSGQIVDIIVYDGAAPYSPPPGTTLQQDDGTHATWVPQAPQ